MPLLLRPSLFVWPRMAVTAARPRTWASTWLAMGIALALQVLAPEAIAQGTSARACPPQAPMPTSDPASQAGRKAQDRGLLWRITRDGHSSWLYGTLHVGRAEWQGLGPTLRGALDSSDLLAVELDGQNPRVRELIADSMRRPGPAVPEPLKRQLADRLVASCVPAALVAQIGTVMQAVLLSMTAARWEGLHGEFGSEVVLGAWAQAQRMKVVSLETVKRQFAALTPDNEAMAADMVRSTLEQHDQQLVRPMLLRLTRAWERGDIDEIEGYERWCECIRNDNDRRMMKRINDDRNPDMARAIDDMHRGGRRVFAAVGALHMTGPLGLPKLMAQRGYKVERIAFGTR